jgi:serine/threonine-protein kinase HipA
VTKQLFVLADDRVMGVVYQGRDGRLSFTYDPGWQNDPDAFPLSLSMPLAVAQHEHGYVSAFLTGLLPDNETVLARWGQEFGVSRRNAFALLAHVGEDCAGAAQFVRPERLDALFPKPRTRQIQWLTVSDVAARLRALGSDAAAWRLAGDTGQFSLAGAKPKTALLCDGKRWGVPWGRTPTTHILKPPTPDFDGIVENEHLCLRLAHTLGLVVAESRVERFDDQIAIVLERFDRVINARRIIRIHQEDTCQALGVSPTRKYENEGGPGAREVVELLRNYSSNATEDVATFVDALIFNWLIAGTDAHAKNYALLLGRGGRVRLAPLYDLTSALPYPDTLDPRRIKFAMRIGREYVIRRVGPVHWTDLATMLRLNPEDLRRRVMSMTERTPDAIAEVRREAEEHGLTHPLIPRLETAIVARARELLKYLHAPTTSRPAKP